MEDWWVPSGQGANQRGQRPAGEEDPGSVFLLEGSFFPCGLEGMCLVLSCFLGGGVQKGWGVGGGGVIV